MSMLTSAQITALWHYARKHRITSDLELADLLYPVPSLNDGIESEPLDVEDLVLKAAPL